LDITANCIAPGVIVTGRIMQTVIPGSQSNRDRAGWLYGVSGRVEDCARMVEFLATDLFDYVTRATIPLDGTRSGTVIWGVSLSCAESKIDPESSPKSTLNGSSKPQES
jgi:3-oxoacyl-[acyl-carrier protein] reductase